MRPLRWPSLVFLLLVPMATLAPAWAGSEPPVGAIQPGAHLYDPYVGGWGCTQGFVFRDDAGSWYGSTAGHCVEVGDRVSAGPFEPDPFGTVVHKKYDSYGDFAIFLVDTEDEGLIEPGMRYWGGPTGVGHRGEVAPGDVVLHTGYPYGVEVSGRFGYLSSQTAYHFFVFSVASFGDSGSPFLAAQSGLALGLNCCEWVPPQYAGPDAPPEWHFGATVESMLSFLAEAGYDLTLQTAPLNEGAFHP